MTVENERLTVYLSDEIISPCGLEMDRTNTWLPKPGWREKLDN